MTEKRNIIHTYKLHPSLRDYECFYCGTHAESKDHIPPISYPEDFEEENRIIVRCCLLCNSLLNNRYLLTLLSRCEYLLFKYEFRFKKVLSLPLWDKEEIDELKGKLKRSVILGLKKKKYIENKILFIKKNITALQGY